MYWAAAGHWVCIHAGQGVVLNVAEPHGSGERYVRLTYVARALKTIDAVRAEEQEE